MKNKFSLNKSAKYKPDPADIFEFCQNFIGIFSMICQKSEVRNRVRFLKQIERKMRGRKICLTNNRKPFYLCVSNSELLVAEVTLVNELVENSSDGSL